MYTETPNPYAISKDLSIELLYFLPSHTNKQKKKNKLIATCLDYLNSTIGGGAGGAGGGGGGRGSPKQKFGSIGDTRAQILCSQTTEELPKKYHKAGTPEQKSITDTLRCLLVPTKNAFWII